MTILKCPNCNAKGFEITRRENLKYMNAKKGSWVTYGICSNTDCRFNEEEIGF